MKLQSFYSFIFLALFSLTCVSCSHSGVRTAEADLSDEAVAENTESEETNQAVALMDETPSEELVAEKDSSSNEDQEPVFALNESNNDSGSTSNEVVTNDEGASQSEAGSGVYSSSIDQPSSNEPVAAPKHRARNKANKNWQKVERKPTAKLSSPVDEDRVVNSEIENAIAREVLPQVAESAPALDLKAEPKPELASVEISSFTQRHSWLVAFSAAGLILFLFFALTRNRAKKDMSL